MGNVRSIAERTLMPACTGSAAEYVADGVEAFLLLDLDGVFVPDSYSTSPKEWFSLDRGNAVRYPNKYYDPSVNYSRVSRYDREPKSFEIRWSSELISKLNSIAADPAVQVVWVTTWREDMGGVVDFMGVKSARPMVYLPWSGSAGERASAHSDKVPAVDGFLNSESLPPGHSTKVVWVDDIALKGLTASHGMFHQFNVEDVLLVAPVSRHGLSYSDWDGIVELLDHN